MQRINIDTEAGQRLLMMADNLEYCERLSNHVLADLLFDTIVMDLPVLSPEFALLSTIVNRLRDSEP